MAFRGRLFAKWESYDRNAIAIRIAQKKFTDNVHAVHAHNLYEWEKKAEAIFRQSLRPNEHDRGRDGRRMTGKFSFGRGGSIRGVLLREDDKGRMSFALPDVERADEMTNYVWRSLESGLPPRGSGEYVLGYHKIPTGYWLDPSGRPSASRHTGGEVSLDVFQPSRHPRMRRGKGFVGKWFIRDSAVDIAAQLGSDYERVAQKAFRNI